MKAYSFLDNFYTSLNDLALAYINNFDEAINDIYSNSKKLIKFVKYQSKNKILIDNVINALAYSKYKNNALTFIIYYLLQDKKVFINGNEYSFENFCEALAHYEASNSNALYAFMEDFGLTKTYHELYSKDDDSIEYKILKDSYYLDKNCYKEFTRLFLSSYKTYAIKESYEPKIKSIIINGEECFRRATKLLSTNDFYLYVAHKYDFKTAITISNEANPVFYSLRLFKSEIEPEDLKKIISDTFYWHLLDNLDKYTYKSEAKATLVRLNNIKNDYNKYLHQIEAKKIYSISLDLFIDFSRDLYLNYINFIHYFQNGIIQVKNRVSQNLYAFDKPYCKTFICQDYMNNRIIKLYNPDKNNNTTDLDDVTNDTPCDLEVFKDQDIINKLKKQKKILNAVNRLKNFSIFFSIISLIIIIFGIVAAYVPSLNITTTIPIVNTTLYISLAVTLVILLVACAIISFRLPKSKTNVDNYQFILEKRNSNELTVKQEYRLMIMTNDEAIYEKKSFYSYIIETTICQIALSVLFGLMTLVTIFIIKSFGILESIIPNSKFESYLNSDSQFLYFGIAPVIMGLFSIFIKKKGFFVVLLNLLLSLALFLIMFIFM